SSIVCIFIGRVILREAERSLYRRGLELRNAVIIGSNEIADRVCATMLDHPLLGYRLAGYFSDAGATSQALGRIAHLGSLGTVPDKLADLRIELALIALDHEEHQKIFKLVQDCEGVNVEFLMVPDILELMASNMAI